MSTTAAGTPRSIRWHSQPQTAFLAAAGLTNASDGVVRLIEHGARQIDQEPAWFGQPDAAAGVVEEGFAQLLFESPDVLMSAG